MKILTNVLKRLFLGLILGASLYGGGKLGAQDTLKVMQYNLLYYGVSGLGCTSPSTRLNYLSTIVTQIKPDIFGVNELSSNTTYANNILSQVLQPLNPAYERATLTNNAGSDITNMLFYNSDKLALKNQFVINHTLRDLNYYQLYYKAADLATNTDTVYLHVVVAHLKAGSQTSDANTRASQTQTIMNFLNALGLDDNLIIMGDFNVQSSSETSYQNMVNHTNAAIKMYDPVNSPGSWNYNSVFACLHTQSTSDTPVGCGSGGGLDDRFDFILINNALKSNTYDASLVNGSYKAFGNDCNHFNGPINNPTNSAVSTNVANALKAMSDHLPITAEFKVNRAPAVGRDEPRAFLQGIDVELLGNPVAEMLDFRVRNLRSQSADLKLRVTDLGGRILMEEQMNVLPGAQRFSYPASQLAAGLYLLQISDAKGNFACKKLIKR